MSKRKREPGESPLDLGGKVCLITGAASGIGRVAARRWAQAGGIVAALDVNSEGLIETAESFESIQSYPLDVTNRSAVEAVVKAVETDLGPLERVYNGAAIQPTGLLLDCGADEIQRVMQINYGGIVNVSLATLPRMLERGSGVLVNFASIAGWIPTLHFGAYNASKFAIVAFTEVLHHENRGGGAQVICVCPSQVATPLVAQATSNPKILNTGPAPMTPEKVLDAVDVAVEKGRFWVFPGAHTKAAWLLRRFFPALMWKIDHNAEGF